MRRKIPTCAAVVLLAFATGVRAQDVSRREVIDALIQRSRLLKDVRFTVPVDLYRQHFYKADGPAPVGVVRGDATYHLKVGARGEAATVAATVRLQALSPGRGRMSRVLSGGLAWRKVMLSGKPRELPTVDGWIQVPSDKMGEYVVTAEAAIAGGSEGALGLDIVRTARTIVRFDSPEAWEVTADERDRRVRGTGEGGTHGQMALSPRRRLTVAWRRPRPAAQRPARFQIRGDVAWDLDVATQQVTAKLNVAILGGPTRRIDLLLPGGVERLRVTGPDVREVRAAPGGAGVFLRGQVRGQTRLTVRYERPTPRGGERPFGRLAVADGHWAGGTLVVSNTAGESEVLPAGLSGLKRLALADIPRSAASILPAAAVMAFEITSRNWSANLDVVNLSEFALRESIADLAHYELAFRPDGSVMCKAAYEIRNRTQQFLRLSLPPGAQILLARVNEKPCPITPAADEADTVLLPLVRSKASIKGLVSFPVEVVLMYRTSALARRGLAEMTLPRVDLPIAYAWCEAYVPAALKARKWSGPMNQVDQYSSETATAHLGYGRGELAEGYQAAHRPTVAAARARQATAGHKRDDLQAFLLTPRFTPMGVMQNTDVWSQSMLAKNYWRAGNRSYERGDYANAAANLEQVLRLAPKSPEAPNAERLLSNVRMLSGKLALKSRAEKAAGAKVQSRIQEKNKPIEQEQARLLAKGFSAARAGRQREAEAQFQAAQALGEQLIGQGADRREQEARLRAGRGKLAQLRQSHDQQFSGLRKMIADLKAAGDYERALSAAKELRRKRGLQVQLDAPNGPADGQKLLEELTILAAKQRAQQRRERDKKVRVSREMRKLTLRNTSAAELSNALKQLFERPGRSEGRPDAQPVPPPPGFRVNSQANELIIEGTPDQFAQIEKFVSQLDVTAAVAGTRADQDRPPLGPLVRRHKRIQHLTQLAKKLRAQKEYKQATRVLDEILQLDPRNAWADEWKRWLESDASLRQEEERIRRRQDETKKTPLDARAGGIPWYELQKYPKDWRELTGRRAGDAGVETVRQRLRQKISKLEFTDIELKDVVQFLRDVTQLNIQVKWAMLGLAGIDKSTAVNIHLTDVSADKALRAILDDVGAGSTQLNYVVEDGVVTISTKEDLSSRTVIQVYDIRDMLVRVPNFRGPRIEMSQISQKPRRSGRRGTGFFDDGLGGEGGQLGPSRQWTNEILDLIRNTIDPASWRAAGGEVGGIRELHGQLVVTQTAENHKMLLDLIRQLREARGPQVRTGANVAKQIAKGWISQDGATNFVGVEAGDKRLRKFVERNYAWQRRNDGGFAYKLDDLAGKLGRNLGQNVTVRSSNTSLSAEAAERLGVRFRKGNNDVRFGVIDEAQFRTLMQLGAARPKPFDEDHRKQDTIVGTDALLANKWKANVLFGGDYGNTIDIRGNQIALPHERYVLIDNNGYLTAVRAGQMRHWTQAAEEEPLVEVPEEIDVPRAGRRVKFEKTLVKPTDRLILRVEYDWQGDRR